MLQAPPAVQGAAKGADPPPCCCLAAQPLGPLGCGLAAGRVKVSPPRDLRAAFSYLPYCMARALMSRLAPHPTKRALATKPSFVPL